MELVLFATIIAITLTVCVYLFPEKYATLWLSLEVIILPTVYTLGYKYLMDKQRKGFENDINEFQTNVRRLEEKYHKLKNQ